MLCDDISLKAQLLLIDTMLVAVWLWCIPPRFANISNFLRNPTQKCDLQAIAPLLAAEGVEHATPLIWLYRSKHAHKCALEHLVKVSCFANVFDAWDHLQSLRWRARYLQSLWWSRKSREIDLAINHVIRMFPVAPALGLAVLTGTKIITHDDDDDNDRTWQGSGNTKNVVRLNDSFACIENLELSPRPTWANHRLSSCLWDPLSALNFFFVPPRRTVLHACPFHLKMGRQWRLLTWSTPSIPLGGLVTCTTNICTFFSAGWKKLVTSIS